MDELLWVAGATSGICIFVHVLLRLCGHLNMACFK